MNSTFSNARIQSISCSVPSQEISLENQVDLFYNGNLKKVERIKKTIGLNKRRIVDSNTTTLDLCYDATLNLLKNLKNSIEIDAIIFVTQTPDFLQPNNAHLLHHKLNLSQNCLCFDINQGCSGYIYGLFMAYLLIDKGAKHVLLCAGDTLSKILHPSDSNTTPLFGDAGSATLITRSESKSFFSLHSDGKGWENIILANSAYRTNATLQKHKTSSPYLQMDGAEIFNFSIDKEPKAILEILSLAQKEIHQINYIFFHQANAYIISNIARRLKIDLSRTPTNSIQKYGNTSSASIPLAICDLLHLNHKNNLEVILSGFGVGLSWASAMLTLHQDTNILHPNLFKGRDS